MIVLYMIFKGKKLCNKKFLVYLYDEVILYLILELHLLPHPLRTPAKFWRVKVHRRFVYKQNQEHNALKIAHFDANLSV